MLRPEFRNVLSGIERFAKTAESIAALQVFAVNTIAARLAYYNWVGFYMLAPDDSEFLVLGPFHGAPTEHVRIPVAQGLCGAAAALGKTVVVDDVASDPRYLSCSIETQSEIIAPIYVHGKVAGEIDVDSHTLSAFGPEDRTFLEECAALIGQFIECARIDQ